MIDFQLKSKGSIPLNEAFSAASEYKDGISDETSTYFYTGENNENVKWRMDIPTAEKLEPGAFGELTFWVVPGKANVKLDMKFSVNIRGFTKSGGTWTGSSNATVLGYLKSHVLFFKTRHTDNGSPAKYSYSDMINPDFTMNNLTESDPVTIYWVWPDTFKQMIYVDGDQALSTAKGIAYDSVTLSNIKLYISDNYTKMFPDSTDGLQTHIANCCEGTASAETVSASVSALDTAYNSADTVLGGMLNGALTEVDAQALAEHEITTP